MPSTTNTQWWYCRGDAFERDHWSILSSKLKMKNTFLEGLCLADFLAVADNLVKQADAVKHLHAQVQGEVALREAIQELKVWCLETEFSLFEHKENGKDVVLVKDWKDLMTALSDNQSLLSSLKDSPYFGYVVVLFALNY